MFMNLLKQSQRMLRHILPLDGRTNPYTVLGVSRLSRPQEIRRQYRRLVRQYHPDLFASQARKNADFQRQCEHKLAEINHAYTLLCG